MKDSHKETILAFAENDMNMTKTAESLCFARNTIAYRLDQIHKLYGLDPERFYDLCELVQMAKKEENK